MYFWTIILVCTIALWMEWTVVNVAASEGESCQSNANCTGVYRKCCTGKCSERKYCLNICSFNHDCASKETCVQQRCIKSCDQDHDCTWQGSIYKACCKKMCSTTTNCDKVCRSDRDCITGETCLLQLCMSFGVNKDCNGNYECSTTKVVNCGGNCADNEDCIDGECQKKSAFSTASIVGFMVVVIIGSCIACVVYCGCARTTGQRMRPTN